MSMSLSANEDIPIMEVTESSERAVESPQPAPSFAPLFSEKVLKTACSECRRQKVKCDANIEVPCSRCRRTSSTCQIVPPLKRVSKRKTLDSPQSSAPKRRLEMATSTPSNLQDLGSISKSLGIPDTPASINTGSPAADPPTMSNSPAPTSVSQQNHHQVTGLENAGQSVPRAALGLEELGMAAAIVRGNAPISPDGPTEKEYMKPSSRCLDGVWVDGRTIGNVFKLYFRHYHPILPILEQEKHPDAYYTQLPFLFWCIVAVGARRYPQDPTIFHSIGQRAVDSATLHNITQRTANVAVIQAVLILITWGYWDRLSNKGSFPLGGLLVHLSMHMGLHNQLSGHDFLTTRTKISEADRRARRELWAHCVIAYQRSCLRIGFPPSSLPRPAVQCSPSNLAFDLDFEVNLHDLMAKASTALTENGLKFESIHQERGMVIILRIFEDQLTDLDHRSAPLKDMDRLYLEIGRLMIQSMYLFQSPDNIDLTCRKNLYVTASLVVDLFSTLDKSTELVAYFTTYHILGLILAGVILLRCLKGSFAKYMDYDACKASFFTSLTLMKNSSVENNDNAARFAMRLSHIWAGDDIFRMRDGTRNEELRVRSRLAMSVVFDTIWWAQDVDGCQHRAGCPHDRPLGSSDPTTREASSQDQQQSVGSSNRGPTTPFNAFNSFLDDEIPYDFGWALGDDMFFAPWQVGTVGGTVPV